MKIIVSCSSFYLTFLPLKSILDCYSTAKHSAVTPGFHSYGKNNMLKFRHFLFCLTHDLSDFWVGGFRMLQFFGILIMCPVICERLESGGCEYSRATTTVKMMRTKALIPHLLECMCWEVIMENCVCMCENMCNFLRVNHCTKLRVKLEKKVWKHRQH